MMDFRKLINRVRDAIAGAAEKSKPKNPQEDAIADLLARETKFESGDLTNLFFSAGGGYLEKIKGEDVRRLQNARALFGHLKGAPGVQVVGYLHPLSSGEVVLTVNGTQVDRLTKESAKRTHLKLNGPTPVKVNVSIIPNRDPKFDRPHLSIARDNKPPRN